jgi:Fic family protein
MNYLSVAETAKRWGMSERTVRNYCAHKKIPGAFLTGKTWNIPQNAVKPGRISKRTDTPKTLLDILKAEQAAKTSGGIYHKVQIELTYNSNHIEGSRLTHEQTRFIFETNTIGAVGGSINVDDIVETANHFKCIDMIITQAKYALSVKFIKELHLTLKNGTSDSRKDWFAVGDYKRMPNEVGGKNTTPPEQTAAAMSALISNYVAMKEKTLADIIDFHVRFESIHPFQDGNGRVGRLIMFKECLRNGIVPFIIYDDMKMFYYRGLSEWNTERGFLTDTCLCAQDAFKKHLEYFRIPYEGQVNSN